MENREYNITLEGVITLLSPLSHIGESKGPDSLLIRGKGFNPFTNKIVEYFRYNGNAFRGMWRDCGSLYLFRKLGNPKMDLATLHLFTSGGAIVGPQAVDLERAKRIRAFFPLYSIFGGSAKSQTLEGKMNIGFGVPLVAETQGIIPERFCSEGAPPWRLLTEEIYLTRQDDSKKMHFKKYLNEEQNEEQAAIETEPNKQIGDGLAEPESTEIAVEKSEQEKSKKKNGPAQQMRVMIEAMCAGTKMYHRIDLRDMTELELGSFVSCLDCWSEMPYIGGKAGVGFGLCSAEYEYWDNGEPKPFIKISQNCVKQSELASNAKKAYDKFLLDLYSKYIEENTKNLAGMLTAAKI